MDHPVAEAGYNDKGKESFKLGCIILPGSTDDQLHCCLILPLTLSREYRGSLKKEAPMVFLPIKRWADVVLV